MGHALNQISWKDLIAISKSVVPGTFARGHRPSN